MRHTVYGRPQKTAGKRKLFFILPFFILLLFFSIEGLNQKILPAALAISHMQAKSVANQAIDSCLQETIKEMALSSRDLYMEEGSGISANTILINEFCARVSMGVSEKIAGIADEKISIPVGALSGIQVLANVGPDISFTMRPMGETAVDYETSFTAVGINQTNYKVWLKVQIAIQLIHPLVQEKIVLERKVMLLDTVMQGAVPQGYLDFNGR